ncbi:hypothetical protein L2E82_14882 [Cichorium intybus]|uniref:Uncharacterized protein n=1 Tax=Cichorium intybus TaxID=13427 RepID=A0ACB9F1B8_CICIN|nr:hypothetical protein L2E82_14882 [Cichorium intybus]
MSCVNHDAFVVLSEMIGHIPFQIQVSVVTKCGWNLKAVDVDSTIATKISLINKFIKWKNYSLIVVLNPIFINE